MESLLHLIYASSAVGAPDQDVLADILRRSRHNSAP